MPVPHRPRLRAAVTAVLVAGVVGSCGTSGANEPGEARATEPGGSAASEPASATASAAADGFPLTVSSCGVEARLAAPPERIVTIKSSATEMVLALGAGDRLVGTAFPDGDLPADLADAARDVPVLAEKNPGSESVLELEPDLVYAGWESNLSADGAGERDMYAGLGIATYVSPSACKSAEHRPDRLTFDLVFDEITEMGAVLGRADAAGALVDAQRAQLGTVEPSTAGLTALWYSSGSDTPYVGGGIGAPQMLMEAVGLRNIAEDVPDTWASLGWESVAAADPDVIVLVDSAWNTAENKIEVLESNPVTAELAAVREGRYLTVPFPATEAGVRNVPAAVDLAAQLARMEGSS